MLKKAAVLFFLLALSVTLYYCSAPSERTQKPQYASLSDDTKYVGIETCAGCHRDIYETFIKTGMGQSFDTASTKKSSARFEGHPVIHDSYKDLSYAPYWSGNKLFLEEFRAHGKDTLFRQDRQISYIVGSGQHTNSHMVNSNGYIYQAPATFYTQKGIWDLPPGFEQGHNSRFGRKIELECMSCHNAYPQMVEGSENKYSFIANGIDCERCHGPGSKHVAEKRKGMIVDITKDVDYSIVNPAKLAVALQLDICQRCHIQGNAVLASGKSFFDFRPGMHLSEVMSVFMPVYKGQENEHIMASHAERMKMSACYKASIQHAEEAARNHPTLMPYRNAMTCVTCHNPHVSVKSTGDEVFNAACRNCHSEAGIHEERAAGQCTGPIKERQAINDNCVTCHMPKNSTIDIPHVMTTDHFIRKPVKREQVVQAKEFLGLACINNPGADSLSRGNAFLNYYEKFDQRLPWLDSARKYLADGNEAQLKNNFNSLVRWAFLTGDYNKVMEFVFRTGSLSKEKSYSNDDAWTAYRVGESCSQLGRQDRAMAYYDTAVQLAPYIPDFRNKLASAQVANRQFDDARKNFAFLVKENPEYATGYVNLGYLVLTIDHNTVAADALYDKALALDPDNEQALLNKAGTQVFLHRPTEARTYLRRLLQVNPGHPTAKQLLNALK